MNVLYIICLLMFVIYILLQIRESNYEYKFKKEVINKLNIINNKIEKINIEENG